MAEDLSSLETASLMSRLQEEAQRLGKHRRGHREKENRVYHDNVRTTLSLMEASPRDQRLQASCEWAYTIMAISHGDPSVTMSTNLSNHHALD